jgi:hypothetical protein
MEDGGVDSGRSFGGLYVMSRIVLKADHSKSALMSGMPNTGHADAERLYNTECSSSERLHLVIVLRLEHANSIVLQFSKASSLKHICPLITLT